MEPGKHNGWNKRTKQNQDSDQWIGTMSQNMVKQVMMMQDELLVIFHKQLMELKNVKKDLNETQTDVEWLFDQSSLFIPEQHPQQW